MAKRHFRGRGNNAGGKIAVGKSNYPGVIGLYDRAWGNTSTTNTQAYDNNVAKFDAVDLEDLKGLHPDLAVVHLTVDTSSDDKSGAEWSVIDRRDA